MTKYFDSVTANAKMLDTISGISGWQNSLTLIAKRYDTAATISQFDFATAVSEMQFGLALSPPAAEAPVGSSGLAEAHSLEGVSLREVWAEAVRNVVQRTNPTVARQTVEAVALVLLCIWWLDMLACHRPVADVVNLPRSIIAPLVLAALLKSDKK